MKQKADRAPIFSKSIHKKQLGIQNPNVSRQIAVFASFESKICI
jgi:hypothetical protein